MSFPSGYAIYHNPRCSTSRKVLAALREAGIEPTIIEYLKTPPTPAEIRKLAKAAGVGVKDLLRTKEALADELGLKAPEVSDDQLIEAIEAHPILLNRPIVVSPKGVKLCRPAETVAELLP